MMGTEMQSFTGCWSQHIEEDAVHASSNLK